MLEHSLGAVVCKGSSTCWHDYELSEHGGWRGQPLGGAAAGVGGAGGVGGVGSARIGASAPVDSMAAWTRRSTLLAARVRRGAPERCAVMARDERRLAACDVVPLLYCRLVVVVCACEARSGHRMCDDAPCRSRTRYAEACISHACRGDRSNVSHVGKMRRSLQTSLNGRQTE